jgi:hypothetical protein
VLGAHGDRTDASSGTALGVPAAGDVVAVAAVPQPAGADDCGRIDVTKGSSDCVRPSNTSDDQFSPSNQRYG